jgi:hypothetical protein
MNKKLSITRIIIIVALIAIVATCVLLLALGSGDEHVPGRTVKEDVIDPTCASRGSYYETTYCLKCNEEMSKERKYTDRLPHDFVDGVCTVCDFDSAIPESTAGLSFIISRDEKGHEVYHLHDVGTCIYVYELVIGSYKGRPVTKILYGALEQCKNLKRVVIHDTVEEIDSYAFD